MILVGLALSFYAWRSLNKIRETDEGEEWEDAVHGGAGESGFLSMIVGAGLILFGGLLALRIL